MTVQPTRVLFLCAGQAQRWAKFGGVPKQLIPIRGEPILHRAVRLAHENDPTALLTIVARDAHADEWKVPHAYRATAHLDPTRKQVDKVLSSRHLWRSEGRTVLLYGDVYWTDEAMAEVMASTDPWTAFARFGKSVYTGCDHRELFGFAFDASENDRIEQAALRCLALHRAKKMGGWSGGWQVYAAATGADDRAVAGRFTARGNIVEIDDWTDDFDYPDDWHRWCLRWVRATDAMRAVGHTRPPAPEPEPEPEEVVADAVDVQDEPAGVPGGATGPGDG